jgi:AcrR family transcriptional regulator
LDSRDRQGGQSGQARHSQEDRSRATRAALVSTARRLFADRGYADVSAAEIVSAAGLTRGALYHHYEDKRDLFRAVFIEMETEMTVRIQLAGDTAAGGLGGAMTAALDAYLSECERDDVVRIMLTDAPLVLGWREWRDLETKHGLGMISTMLRAAMEAGLLVRQPVQVLSQLVLSALNEGALLVADARDATERATVRVEVRQGLLTLFGGLGLSPLT